MSVLMIGEKTEEIGDLELYDEEEYYMEIGENSIFIAGLTVAGMLLGLKAFIRMSEELGTMLTPKRK